MKNKLIARDKEHLLELIKVEIDTNGLQCDLNNIDVSSVTDMNGLFESSKFNGNISNWDVSNVIDMRAMFSRSFFNRDISNWDVSNVKHMTYMFDCSQFNGDISKWNVSNVEDMTLIFNEAQFNNDLTEWKPIKLKKCTHQFLNCNAPIPYWARHEEQVDRLHAIESYILNKELDQELNENSKLEKKIKI